MTEDTVFRGDCPRPELPRSDRMVLAFSYGVLRIEVHPHQRYDSRRSDTLKCGCFNIVTAGHEGA